MNGFAKWQQLHYIVASVPTGGGLKNAVLTIAGNLLIVGLVIFLLVGFARQSVGKIIGVLILGAFCAWVINSPDSFVAVIKSIGELFGQ